jgi:hypothetical protein
MRALETFAIDVTPFLFLGAIARFLVKRRAVDLTDIQAQVDLTAGLAALGHHPLA